MDSKRKPRSEEGDREGKKSSGRDGRRKNTDNREKEGVREEEYMERREK